MASSFSYPVELEKASEGGFVVTFPDVPEAMTQGENKTDALAHAVDALETALEFYTEVGKALPRARKPKRHQPVISPSTLVILKLEVYQATRDQGIKKSALSLYSNALDRRLEVRVS